MVNHTEGERSEPKRRVEEPGVLAPFLHRGLRPAHVHKGRTGTWETSLFPSGIGMGHP